MYILELPIFVLRRFFDPFQSFACWHSPEFRLLHKNGSNGNSHKYKYYYSCYYHVFNSLNIGDIFPQYIVSRERR